jgi:hypothetical protein
MPEANLSATRDLQRFDRIVRETCGEISSFPADCFELARVQVEITALVRGSLNFAHFRSQLIHLLANNCIHTFFTEITRLPCGEAFFPPKRGQRGEIK